MPVWIWLVPGILLALFGALLFSEWYRVGVIADPQVIKRYPFGGVGPVAGALTKKSSRRTCHRGLM
jgi:hypothetical protein